MTIVSVAITLSFHLKNQPSELELRIATPLGAIFWVLSVVTLCLGIGNYISMPSLLYFCVDVNTDDGRDRKRVQPQGGYCADRMEDAAGKPR